MAAPTEVALVGLSDLADRDTRHRREALAPVLATTPLEKAKEFWFAVFAND